MLHNWHVSVYKCICGVCIFSCVMYMRVYNEPRFMAMMCYKVILLGCFAPLYICPLCLNVDRIYIYICTKTCLQFTIRNQIVIYWAAAAGVLDIDIKHHIHVSIYLLWTYICTPLNQYRLLYIGNTISYYLCYAYTII